jgi:hypothetical protein
VSNTRPKRVLDSYKKYLFIGVSDPDQYPDPDQHEGSAFRLLLDPDLGAVKFLQNDNIKLNYQQIDKKECEALAMKLKEKIYNFLQVLININININVNVLVGKLCF